MDIHPEVHNSYLNKLKNKLYGLLCEREKNRDWEKYLDNIWIELMGFPEDKKTINYLILCYKLNSCRVIRLKYFKGVIFECMNLIGTLEE